MSNLLTCTLNANRGQAAQVAALLSRLLVGIGRIRLTWVEHVHSGRFWQMPPTTSRDFQHAAAQRLNTAETLLREKLTLDAQYLDGYTVECSLTALIVEVTSASDKPDRLKKITAGAKWHRPEVLLGELRDLTVELPLDLARRMRRFVLVNGPALRNRTAGYW